MNMRMQTIDDHYQKIVLAMLFIRINTAASLCLVSYITTTYSVDVFYWYTVFLLNFSIRN